MLERLKQYMGVQVIIRLDYEGLQAMASYEASQLDFLS
jgi:hypothetical protein